MNTVKSIDLTQPIRRYLQYNTRLDCVRVVNNTNTKQLKVKLEIVLCKL